MTLRRTLLAVLFGLVLPLLPAAGFFQGSGTLLVALLANLRRLAFLFGLLGFLCSLRSLLLCKSGFFRSTTLCE